MKSEAGLPLSAPIFPLSLQQPEALKAERVGTERDTQDRKSNEPEKLYKRC